MPTTKVFVLGLFALSLGLTACETAETPTGTTSPSPGTPNSSATPTVSGTPVPVTKVQVQIQIQNSETKAVLPGAKVTLTSSSEATQQQVADASGRVTFKDLRQDTQYSLDVQAEGYEGATRTANLSQLATLGQKDLLLAVELKSVRSTLSGRVLDGNGSPLAGATVFDTRQTVATDSAGKFTLGYASFGAVQLTIGKSGYQSVSQTEIVSEGENQNIGDIRLSPKTGQLQLALDISHVPLGQSGALASYSSLQSTLAAKGFTVQTVSSGLESKLANTDVLLMLSPSAAFSSSESSALQSFVASGGKLIVTGEWAGFGGFNGNAVNQVLSPLGVQFSGDTLRDNSTGYLSITSFDSHAISSGLKELKLYQSGSVRLGETGKGSVVARSSSNTFQILSNTGSFAVVLASTYGSGKVVLVGDTSLWSNEDSDGNGTANFSEADNKKLLEQILDW